MISVFQFRAARSGIDITLKDLSKSIEESSVFEIPKISKLNQKKITDFYSSCGVKFIENNSVTIDFKSH